MDYYEPNGAFQSDKASDPDNTPCFCVGRQWVSGELQPACPCAMRKAVEHKGEMAMKLFGAINHKTGL